ncbi:hypothetical protein D9619_010209 [Psilocybe cf. subviscida]|uniref:Uncharacterized protein n=1 Tax=Psilocybe cf. subviscida TaxID=2480587 RepID=A0A8H5AS85_9AGAR|nr:hypothetical protein D9619_010209 [Psilocybe cf. subviscida]
MDHRTPSQLSEAAPAAAMPGHRAGDVQQPCQLAEVLKPAQPSPCRHILDAPTPNTRIRPWSSNNPTYPTTSRPTCHGTRTLATDFAIVVCLAYVLVAAVIFLTGPPSTTSSALVVGIIGPLCFLTFIVFAALGLIRAVVWLFRRVCTSMERRGGLNEEVKEGDGDNLDITGERDVEAGGEDITRKIRVARPQRLFLHNEMY